MENTTVEPNDKNAGRASKRWKPVLAVALIIAVLGGGWVLKEGLPWLHGIQAYIYGFPLIMMDLTKEAATAVPVPGEFTAPVNQFSVMTKYPDASFRAVARTGLDTLFACAWVDLEKEPLVLSVPETKRRYYVIALFDFWSNVFASIGKRTTGNGATNFLVAGPGWQGTLPAGVKQVFRSPTRFVWVNGQMQANGSQDYAEVNALQKQYKLTPLSAWGKACSPPSEMPVAAGVDTKTPTLEQIQKMDAATYFGRCARLMKDNPATPADAPMVEKLKSLGLDPGNDFDFTRLAPGQARALRRAMLAFGLLEKGVKKLTTKNGWIVMPKNMGNYGVDYMTRAGIAMVGLGAIQPVDISYPTAFDDGKGKPLDSSKRYVLHFEKEQTPPANVGWSLSAYDPQGFYVPNALDRYNLAAWMPLKYNDDGSIDFYIQTGSPGPDKETNWLPTPASGPFNLVVRIFWPKESALDGTWRMPGVRIAP